MKFEVIKMDENVYRIFSCGVHEDLFLGSDRALLWDTGCGEGGLGDTVRQLTGTRELIVVNSHVHPDHAFGNWEFQDCRTYMHPDDIAIVSEFDCPKQRKWVYDNMICGNCDQKEGDYIKEKKIADLIPMEDGKEFDLGGITLQVIHLPGHTPGCCGLLYKEKEWLYSGDCISPWQFAPETMGLKKWMTTLEKMKALPFKKMYASHMREAQETSDHGEKHEIDKYIRGIESAWKNGYEKGYAYPNPVGEESVRAFMMEGFTEKEMMLPNTVCAVVSKNKFY